MTQPATNIFPGSIPFNEFEVETDLALTLVERERNGSGGADTGWADITRLTYLVRGCQRRGQRSTTGAGGCCPDDARGAQGEGGNDNGKELA